MGRYYSPLDRGDHGEKTKSIVLMKYRPMIEEFRQAVIEERKRATLASR